MPTVLLALTTSLLFGVGDFLGGIATRRDSAYAVTGTSHLLSIVLLGIAVVVLPAATPSSGDLLWGAASGLSGVIGVMSLFAALALGRMSIVAPVVAALSAALPALFDLVSGTRLSPVTLGGIVLALVAIVIVSLAPDDRVHAPAHEYRPRLALALSLVAGVGFSGAFISYSFTSAESGLTPVLAARVVSIVVSVALAFIVGRGFPADRTAMPAALGAGLTDALANVTMLTAIRLGPLAIASVLGSLFPVVVVVLARVFLGERLTGLQRAGVALALVAVLLSAAP
ncbi:MAG: DMT family transporter [Coriobacteriia bacterium]|nr:DMT family transporter [Coriobacteriia bacterium]MBN2847771.1 DMT family transporter [Coriobacteriia bacterium]